MSNVIDFPGVTSLDINPDRIIEQIRKVDPTQVIVLGYDAEGNEFFSSSMADGPEILWLLERMKMQLLSAGED